MLFLPVFGGQSKKDGCNRGAQDIEKAFIEQELKQERKRIGLNHDDFINFEKDFFSVNRRKQQNFCRMEKQI